MLPTVLFFLCNVLPRKNICHACPVEKLCGVVQVPLVADFLLFLLESKICIKHACDNFCTVIIYYLEPRKNTKSVV